MLIVLVHATSWPFIYYSPRICSGGYSDWNWPTSGNQAAWFAAVTYANEQGTKHLLNAPKFCMAFTAFITNIDQYICLKENNQSFNAIWKVCVWFLWDWCLFKVKYLNELIRWDIHLEITPDIRHEISHNSAIIQPWVSASDSKSDVGIVFIELNCSNYQWIIRYGV